MADTLRSYKCFVCEKTFKTDQTVEELKRDFEREFPGDPFPDPENGKRVCEDCFDSIPKPIREYLDTPLEIRLAENAVAYLQENENLSPYLFHLMHSMASTIYDLVNERSFLNVFVEDVDLHILQPERCARKNRDPKEVVSSALEMLADCRKELTEAKNVR